MVWSIQNHVFNGGAVARRSLAFFALVSWVFKLGIASSAVGAIGAPMSPDEVFLEWIVLFVWFEMTHVEVLTCGFPFFGSLLHGMIMDGVVIE